MSDEIKESPPSQPAPKPAPKPTPKVDAPVVQKSESKTHKSEPLYRLDLYRPNGEMRADISRGLYLDMSKRYGDIMRAIPTNKWITLEEIVQGYWEMDKRLRWEMNRTRKQIESAVFALLEATMVVKKG